VAVATETQARQLPEENREIVSLLAANRQVRGLLIVAVVVLCAGAWALYDVARLGEAQLAIALVALGVIVGFVASSVPVWNRLLAHARDETPVANPGWDPLNRSERAQPQAPEYGKPPRRPGKGPSPTARQRAVPKREAGRPSP
jgi:hypothetical protein